MFVPKSLSLSTPSPPPNAPPPAPLPPLPVSGRVTSPTSLQRNSIALEHPEHLRRRARATLVEVWRRHVLSVVAPQHLPAAGYLEWTLIAMASETRAEIESSASNRSNTMARESMYRRVQSEGRNALDFGDRSDICEVEHRRCRAPSPFSSVVDVEDTDRVVYPRQEQGKEILYLQNRHLARLLQRMNGVFDTSTSPGPSTRLMFFRSSITVKTTVF